MDLSRLKIDDGSRSRGAPAARGRGGLGVGLALLLAFALAVGLLFGERALVLVRERLPALSGARPVRTARAERFEPTQGGELTTASGYVVARTKASLGSEVLGRITRLEAEPGARVEAGQILAELEHDDLDAAVAVLEGELARARAEQGAARAQVALAEAEARALEQAVAMTRAGREETVARMEGARREIERIQQLAAQATERERDLARTEAEAWLARLRSADAELQGAEARLATALRQVELSRAQAEVVAAALPVVAARLAQARAARAEAFIRAPFSGVVLRKEAEVGEVVIPAPGGDQGRAYVVTLADFATLELEVDVFERDIHLVADGAPASIRLDAYPRQPQRGRVRLIQPTADRQKATVQVKVAFQEVPAFARPEMAATVVFLRPDMGDRAAERARVLVPLEAVDRRQEPARVWLIREGQARAQAVELAGGDPEAGRVEVTKGLRGGEVVIVGPFEGLDEGARIQVEGGEQR